MGLFDSFNFSLTIINNTNRTLKIDGYENSSGQWNIAPQDIPEGQSTVVGKLHNSAFRGIVIWLKYKYDDHNSIKLHYSIPYSTGGNESGCDITGSVLRSDYEQHGKIASGGHLFNVTITVGHQSEQPVELASWMGDMKAQLESKRLCDILIPGSHDSATYSLDPILAPKQDIPDWINAVYAIPAAGLITMKIIHQWAKAQGENTYNQLKNGIRYLDFRVLSVQSGTNRLYRACHSLYGPDYVEVFADVKKFATEHPNEILILDFNHLYRFDDASTHADFVSLIKKTFEPMMFPRSTGDDSEKFTYTLGDVWKAKKNIIVLYDDNDTVSRDMSLWCSGLPSAYGNKGDIEELKHYLEGNIGKEKIPGRFFSTQLQLTPTGGLIAAGLVPLPLTKVPESLETLSYQSNPLLIQWLSGYAQRKDCNIILMDWVSDGTSRVIIHMNK